MQHRIEANLSQNMASYPHARLGSSCDFAWHYPEHGGILYRTVRSGHDRKWAFPRGGVLFVDVV